MNSTISPDAKLIKRIRAGLVFFMVGLILSGITAFPLGMEFDIMRPYSHHLPEPMLAWFKKIDAAILHNRYFQPFMSYGTDWLAFAHIVIAVAFIGPYRDPVRNIWVLEFGLIACLMVFPLAFIAGWARGIPLFWRLIDCCFGLFGFVLMYWIYNQTKILTRLRESVSMTTG